MQKSDRIYLKMLRAKQKLNSREEWYYGFFKSRLLVNCQGCLGYNVCSTPIKITQFYFRNVYRLIRCEQPQTVPYHKQSFSNSGIKIYPPKCLNLNGTDIILLVEIDSLAMTLSFLLHVPLNLRIFFYQ